ncbi:helix-turn-helix transcriptional regulator [Clostridium sp. WILCCON 0269]|uniref:Helix-turn-helix transcriptional regulator n=1 Tax=Candidatus Clostridium eludens TaxID=3381663 RepID=A0ABW8SNH8_9CLOT
MNNNIKELVKSLKSKGISTSEIIKESGLSRTQFYAILNEDCIPKLDTANKICKVLKANIEDVFPELKRKRS